MKQKKLSPRWQGSTAEGRRAHMVALARKRMAGMTKAQRVELGKRLTAARQKVRAAV